MSSHSLADINADSRSSANTGMMKKTNHMEHKYITYTVHFAYDKITDSNNKDKLRIGYRSEFIHTVQPL